MRPHPIDDETIEQLRKLVAAMYGGRNGLYAAAGHLDSGELKLICRSLAEHLAGETTYLEQIVVSHGRAQGFEEAVTSALSDQIMKLLRDRGGDEFVVSKAKQAQSELRGIMDETIGSNAQTRSSSTIG